MEHQNLRSIRSLKSLAQEDLALTLGAYGIFALYCLGYIGFIWLQLGLMVYVIRVFNIRHEKAHRPLNKSGLYRILDHFEVFHIPYQEPFSAKRQKHIEHHRAHLSKRSMPKHENAHRFLESSFLGSVLSAFFYHELMLIIDVTRERRISNERLRHMVISTAGVAATVFFAGTQNFLAFLLAYRVASFIAWFSFSYVLHLDWFYFNELGPKLPRVLKRGFEWIFGSGSVTAIFYHQFHHTHPNHFHKF